MIADALSRKPLVGRESRIYDIELSDDITALVDAVQQNWPVTEDRLTEIRVKTSIDPIIKSITDFIANGWPNYESAVPHTVRDYYRERALLSLSDGVVIYKLQIVMPPKMRDDALRRLHESHQGISKCRERAASAIWWPDVSRDIKRFIDRCDTCRCNRPTQREQSLRPVDLPGKTRKKVAKRNYYPVTIDHYPRWIEIKQLTSLTSDCVVSRVKTVFTMHGIPDVVVSDNGNSSSRTNSGNTRNLGASVNIPQTYILSKRIGWQSELCRWRKDC